MLLGMARFFAARANAQKPLVRGSRHGPNPCVNDYAARILFGLLSAPGSRSIALRPTGE